MAAFILSESTYQWKEGAGMIFGSGSRGSVSEVSDDVIDCPMPFAEADEELPYSLSNCMKRRISSSLCIFPGEPCATFITLA